MTIEPINGVPEVPKSGKVKGRKVEGTPSQSQDNVTISSEARLLQKLEEDIKLANEAIKEVPDVRQEKVNLAKERLESGFYNDKKVINVIAERLSRALGIS